MLSAKSGKFSRQLKRIQRRRWLNGTGMEKIEIDLRRDLRPGSGEDQDRPKDNDSNSERTRPRLRLFTAIVALSPEMRTLALFPLLLAISPIANSRSSGDGAFSGAAAVPQSYFQRSHGLTIDGWDGAATIDALRAALLKAA
jgi:hypothetical protein